MRKICKGFRKGLLHPQCFSVDRSIFLTLKEKLDILPQIFILIPKICVNVYRKGFMSTIKDVANLAKVSIATVSRVLNDTGPVSPDEILLRRIQESAEPVRNIVLPDQLMVRGSTGPPG